VNVEFVIAEPERDAVLAVMLDRHAQHARVKIKAAMKVARRQYNMVECFNHRRLSAFIGG
jgi:hypothetical protein